MLYSYEHLQCDTLAGLVQQMGFKPILARPWLQGVITLQNLQGDVIDILETQDDLSRPQGLGGLLATHGPGQVMKGLWAHEEFYQVDDTMEPHAVPFPCGVVPYR